MASGYSVQPDVEIEIETISGDLVVEGRSESEIRARGDDPELRIENDGQKVKVNCDGDCKLKIPVGARLRIKDAEADVRITDLIGPVEIEHVGASLVVRDTGPVTINSVGADLEIKRIRGSVKIDNIGADATFREITGSVEVNDIGADALLSEIAGACKIDSIGSDLILKTEFAADAQHKFGHIGNDVLVKVDSNANVRLILPSDVARRIGIRAVRPEILENGDHVTITLGSGTTEISFESIGGQLVLDQPGYDADEWFENMVPENLDEIISAQINMHIDGLREEAERTAERARQQAERAAERVAERARRNAEHLRREAERNAERARRHSHRHDWGFEFSWPGNEKRKRGQVVPPVPPIPPIPPMPGFMSGEKRKRDQMSPAEPVSNEERMTILRMVENKQITVEEAERLLSALEGQE